MSQVTRQHTGPLRSPDPPARPGRRPALWRLPP